MENKTNWRQKLTSRKLWFAIVGVVIGAAMAFGIEGSEIEEIIGMLAGAATAIGSIIGYIDGESAVDAARAKSSELASLLSAAVEELPVLEEVPEQEETEKDLGYLELAEIPVRGTLGDTEK